MYKINIKKLIRSAVVLMLTGLFLSFTFAYLLKDTVANTAPDDQDNIIIVVVESGDTLWELVKKHQNPQDIRKAIYNVKKINQLATVEIHPGQILKIPK